jgi:hypothetical protein
LPTKSARTPMSTGHATSWASLQPQGLWPNNSFKADGFAAA